LNECRNGMWLLERCGSAAMRVRRGGPSAGARRGAVLLSPSLKELRSKSIDCGARWAKRVPAAAVGFGSGGGAGRGGR
jgi:hypothetical protein